VLNNREDAEDVSQEVMIRMSRNIKNLQNAKTFKGWLAVITANETRRFLKKKSRKDSTLEIDDYENDLLEERDEFLPAANVENSELRQSVMNGISSLPLRQRESVLFYYFDGLSTAEIAEAMEVSVPCVSQYLTLARRKLQVLLEKNYSGVMAATPLGGIISGTLQYEGAGFVFDLTLAQSVVAKCSELAYAVAEEGLALGVAAVTSEAVAGGGVAAISKTGLGMGAVLVAGGVFATATAVAAGITIYSDNIETNERVLNETVIEFRGGRSFGEEFAHVNPAGVRLSNEEMSVIGWQITRAGDNDILFEGPADTLDSTLLYMRRSDLYGEFMLYIDAETEAWTPHNIRSNFYLLR
jgi:RNA polymerase sigma-70 factor (ECF subfamily)